VSDDSFETIDENLKQLRADTAKTTSDANQEFDQRAPTAAMSIARSYEGKLVEHGIRVELNEGNCGLSFNQA
jgi:hypothetical protein